MSDERQPRTVLVDITGLNAEYLRHYDRTHPNPTGPLGKAAKALGRALNQETK